MRSWFVSISPNQSGRRQRPVSSLRLLLEPLEDRCLPSMNSMPASPTIAPSSATVNTIASLSHDQIHMLQDQSQQQTAFATARLETEQAIQNLLQLFASQLPQIRPAIAFLASDIPAQQGVVNSLQNQTNLLNELDDLQDQSIILTAEIQNATALVPMLLQNGDVQAANMVQSIIDMDQTAVPMLQPQIAAVEVEVSAFI